MASADDVNAGIARIRSGSGRIRTNLFSAVAQDTVYELLESEASLVFTEVDDTGVTRAYFVSCDDIELTKQLKQLDEGAFIEIISRNPEDSLEFLESAGFHFFSRFMRVACSHLDTELTKDISPDLLVATDEHAGNFAKVEDVSAIHSLLMSIFDSRTSHIASIAKLEQQVRDKEIIIAKDPRGISSLLVFKLQGRKYYINQVYNRAGKATVHSILLTSLRDAMAKGVTYSYAWVDEQNARSLAFHARYGMKPDGLYCIGFEKA